MYRDIVTSHLKEDTRIRASVLANRRVFENPSYEIYLCLYSGLLDHKDLHADLLTCLVVFREEKLRILFKVWTDEVHGDRDKYLSQSVRRLQAEGRGPFHLIRDAKLWGKVEFTFRDRAALRMAGADAPKPDPKTFPAWQDPEQTK